MRAKVRIDPEGTIRFIWADELQPLLCLGSASIVRASNVEPTPDGEWTADLSPSAGPTLGPFPLRGDALAAEHDWLERTVL